MSEVTIYNNISKSGSLRFYPLSASGSPSEAKYLESRNAAAANENPIILSYPTVGQCCLYAAGWYTYYVYRIPLYFDTSVIPDDQGIISAKLRLYFLNDDTDINFDIVIQNGQPTYPHDPVVHADYFHENYSGDGGSINTSGVVVDDYLEIDMNSLGRTWINQGPGAETKLILRSSREISAIVPVYTSDERIGIYNTSGAYQPRLIIEYGPYKNASGKASITTEITVRDIKDIIINKKATKLAGHLKLYGEILDLNGRTITERGFEYKIQDAEPGKEDTGTEVKETGTGFGVGEYHLSSWDTFNDLYCAEENKIWWFRAYLKDDIDNKFIANAWMKNVPTMTTFECTEVFAQKAKGNGELVDLGANTVTRRGFRIIKEYSGDLWGARAYHSDGFRGELGPQEVYNEAGTLIGFKWVGLLYRDSLYEDAGGYEVGVYDKILGGGFTGEGFGIYLNSNDNLKVIAMAENQLGMGFGEDFYLITKENILSGETILSKYLSPEYQDILSSLVGFTTSQMILPSDDENVSEISAEKTITLGTIPGGATVTRIGIRLGRTMGCNEIHVFEDGSWGTGGSITFYITGFVPGDSYYKIPYIVINYGDYEEEVLAIPNYRDPERLEEWLEDYPIEVFPEVEEEDEEELDTIVCDSSVGDISYRTIIREIKCERIADQSFIDKAGRRRSKTIGNHLIQSRANCKLIINDYIEKFQIIKLKLLIDYDIPIPFEREDVILLGDGKVKCREDGGGLTAFKANGEGEILQQDFILTKIRKIDGRYISGSEAIINIELEV